MYSDKSDSLIHPTLAWLFQDHSSKFFTHSTLLQEHVSGMCRNHASCTSEVKHEIEQE